uniref:R3H domain-containing protein 1-like isoform X2 n=1 Tax=Myxine glutinosa TaxID=7769 RepID=UPI00358F6807
MKHTLRMETCNIIEDCKKDDKEAECIDCVQQQDQESVAEPTVDKVIESDIQQVTSETSNRRSKLSGKMKLVRSMAVCHESPPPLMDLNTSEQQDITALHTTKKDAEEAPVKDEEEKDMAEQETEGKAAKILSRDSSQEYTDSTGIDVHEFLVNTLKNSPRDRLMLLKMEQELIDFIHDANSQYKKFPPMTSYHRMLVHRVAAYFGMDHNVDPTGKAVVINKTGNTRIPEQRFGEHIEEENRKDESLKWFILKRNSSSLEHEDCLNRAGMLHDENRSKSFEGLEEDSSLAYPLPESRVLERSSLTDSTQHRRQLFRRYRNGSSRGSGSQHSSTETESSSGVSCGPVCGTSRKLEARPWSSTDSENSHRLCSRPAVTKASSFSGISTMLLRGDSIGSNHSGVPLSKTNADSSNTMASSSGSLTWQQQTQPLPQVSLGSALNGAAPAFKYSGSAPQPISTTAGPNFCLLPLESMGIPPGSILVNPHTGQPFMNPDGSPAVYHPPPRHQLIKDYLSDDSSPQSQQTVPQQPLINSLVTVNEMGSKFEQVKVDRQSPVETSDSTSSIYSSPVMPQHQSQQSLGFQLPSQSQPMGVCGYGGGMVPQLLPQASHQQVQPQGCAHQGPYQMGILYYPSSRLPHVGQQMYRPMSPSFNTHQGQQANSDTGFQPTMFTQHHNYQGVIGLQNSTSPMLPTQPNALGNSMQTMVAHFPHMASFQMPEYSSFDPATQHHLPPPCQVSACTPASGSMYCSLLPLRVSHPSESEALPVQPCNLGGTEEALVSQSCRGSYANLCSWGHMKY